MRGPFWSLLRTMSLLELRVRETASLLVALAVMLATIMGFGISSAFLDPLDKTHLFPAMVWLLFMLNAAVSLGRSFEYEVEHRVLEGVLLTGVSPAAIFFAKWCTNLGGLAVAQAIGVTVLGVLMGVEVLGVWKEFTLICVGVLMGYSALATLLAALVTTSRLRGVLLPLLLIPLLFPLFFCAVELTSMLQQGGLFRGGRVLWDSPWAFLLAGLALLYVALGALLFEFTIRDRS